MSDALQNGFAAFLRLERRFSEHSIAAYLADVQRFGQYLADHHPSSSQLITASSQQVEQFLLYLNDLGITANTQARTLAGIKAFYKYLLIDEQITDYPLQLIDAPKLQRKLPDILLPNEIESICAAIDHSTPQGMRNRAIIETLYASGLRVSELTALRLSGLLLEQGLLRIWGKGKRERLVPIHAAAAAHLSQYMSHVRVHTAVQSEAEDVVFLNNRGSALSREMVFLIVQKAAKQAHINKKVSPHTFRHSFATHLYEGGADLRAIQVMLGHKAITTTEIYAKVDVQYLRDTLVQFHPRAGK